MSQQQQQAIINSNQGSTPSNSQQQQPNAQANAAAGSTITLTQVSTYKPFLSEKQLINTIAWQENEITTIMRTITELLPRNFRLYKDYGDRVMNNGEKLRLQLGSPGLECKDLFSLLFQLAQFFEIIGRLFSQNYHNVSFEMCDPVNEAVMVIRSHKDQMLSEKALKVLPKAQTLHEQAEKYKQEFERSRKEMQDSLQKMRTFKQDPNMVYNLSDKQGYEEKASKAVKDMEDKKNKYNATLEQLDAKNQLFIESLETLSKEHQTLIDFTAETVKQLMEQCLRSEMNHYEGLNLITPDKGQVIKNFVIKQDLQSDYKVAEDLQLKIDLTLARQKLTDMTDAQTNHQAVSPFCQYINDSSDYFTRVSDKQSKFLTTMIPFLNELYTIEKTVIKFHKEFNLSEKRKKENQFGPFQGVAYEFFRTLEMKERAHQNFARYLETMVMKIDQLVKTYKTEEKVIIAAISKISKEVISQNDKVGKQTASQEKQLVKISSQLSSNQQVQNEKVNSFQNLMIEYTNITDTLKEQYGNYKTYVISQIDSQQTQVKAFKTLQLGFLKNLIGVFQQLTSQEQTFVDQQLQVQREQSNFLDIIDTKNIINQFKCQIINKHSAEFIDTSDLGSSNQEDQDAAHHQQQKQPTDVFTIANDQDGGEEVQTQIIDTNENQMDVSFNGNELDEQSNNIQKEPADDKLISTGTLQSITHQDIEGMNEGKQLTFQQKSLSHQSFISRENSSLDLAMRDTKLQVGGTNIIGRSSVVQNVNTGSNSVTVNYFEQPRMHSQSVIHSNNGIISPLKKQLDRLSQRRDDLLMFDEETQREIDMLKSGGQNLSQSEVVMPLDSQLTASERAKKFTTNNKFIKEKFFGLLEGEKVLESYACAMSLKILVQGRLYVTNKRLCFHSYFNDKTIFGKETKILIPLANVARIEKKTNVMVFDNSISIITKEEKEIFVTSFMFRDQAFDMINQQLDREQGREPRVATTEADDMQQQILNSSSNSDNIKAIENSTGAINDNAPGNSSEDRANPIKEEEEDEFQQPEAAPIQQIFDNSAFKATPEFKQVEQERLQRMYKEFPETEKFPQFGFEQTVDCSLKHIFQVFINYTQRFPQYDNLSIHEWLEKVPMTNIDLTCEKPDGILKEAPDYLTKTEIKCPEPSEFKDWPLRAQFKQSFTHLTEKPKMMQPKSNKVNQVIDLYFISPRMLIRQCKNNLDQIPFSDSFNFDIKFTFEQEESEGGIFRTKVKNEFRVNIIKPIRFIQGTVIKETEASLRDTYVTGPYRAAMFQKILETRELMKNIFESQNRLLPAIGAPKKAAKKTSEKRSNEQKANNDLIQPNNQQQVAAPFEVLPVVQSRVVESVGLNPELIKQIGEIKNVKEDLNQMKLQVSKLLLLVMVLVGLNIATLLALVALK